LDMNQLDLLARRYEIDAQFDVNAFGKWAWHDSACWYYIGIACLTYCAFLAQLVHGKGIFFFSFLMLDYFRRKEAAMIVQSVTVGGPGLIGSAKAAVILILIYACMTFWLFEEQMQPNNACTTSYQCILKTLDAGLHGDLAGAHGDDFEDIWTDGLMVSIQTDGMKLFQWLFTISFLIIWGFILEGIVQGYIVDAFSAIREEDVERIEDSKNNCFICSLSRFDLEEANIKFDTHVEIHHNRWAYLDMVVRILKIPNSKQMTTATIVRRALDISSRDFLPMGVCADMQVQRDNPHQTDSGDADNFQEKVWERLSNMDEQMTRLTELLEHPPAQAGAEAEG